MRRWIFILLGGFGAALAACAGFLLCIRFPILLGYPTAMMFAEYTGIVGGLALAVIGFVQGRRAGELDISQYTKTPRRDYGVAGAEIDFACPICHKAYRASPLLAGKPFTCRDCREVFNVPGSRKATPRAAAQG